MQVMQKEIFVSLALAKAFPMLIDSIDSVIASYLPETVDPYMI